MYTWIYSSRGVSFSRETCRGPPRVHRETCTHARSTDTSVSARECEITRGDGRGQRLRATRVLEARQEPGPRAERPRDTGPCDLRREKGGGSGERGTQSRGGFFSLATTSREMEGDRSEGGKSVEDGSRNRRGEEDRARGNRNGTKQAGKREDPRRTRGKERDGDRTRTRTRGFYAIRSVR